MRVVNKRNYLEMKKFLKNADGKEKIGAASDRTTKLTSHRCITVLYRNLAQWDADERPRASA